MIRITDPNVKVIIAGGSCWNTLGQIRSFGEAGVRPDLVWIRGDEFVPKGSKYVNHFKKVQSTEECLNYILEHYTDRDCKYVISTDSDLLVSMMDQHYDQLKDRFIFFNAAEQGRLTQYMIKSAQCELAVQNGLDAPKSELLSKGTLPGKLRYPIFTKTDNCFTRGWKTDYIICNNEQELLKAYESIKNDKLLLQEFIHKKNEVSLEGISINHGEELYLPVQMDYLHLTDGKYGTWMTNYAYNLGDELKGKIQQILKTIHYSGIFELEFLEDMDGKLLFLEFNFRQTQLNHSMTDMGLNFCKIWAESMLNGRLCVDGAEITKSPLIVMNERWDFQAGYKQKTIKNLMSWISDIRKTDSFYIYNKKDRKPFFDFIWMLIRRRYYQILYISGIKKKKTKTK